MSLPNDTELLCRKCGHRFTVTTWQSINTQMPHAAQDIISRDLWKVTCPNCKTTSYLEYPLLYNDMVHHYMVQIVVDPEKRPAMKQMFREMQKFSPEMKVRFVLDSVHMAQLVQAIEKGRDERVVELFKAVLQDIVLNKNPGFDAGEPYYLVKDGAEYIWFFNKEEQVLEYPFHEDMYDMLGKSFAPALNQIEDSEYCYDYAWAKKFIVDYEEYAPWYVPEKDIGNEKEIEEEEKEEESEEFNPVEDFDVEAIFGEAVPESFHRMDVFHRKYGCGVITDFDGINMTVDFEEGKRRFVYPVCLAFDLLHLHNDQTYYFPAYRQWLQDESRVHVTGFGTGTLTLEYGTYKKQFKEEPWYVSLWQNRINQMEQMSVRRDLLKLRALADAAELDINEYVDRFEEEGLMSSETAKKKYSSEIEAVLDLQKKRGMYRHAIDSEREKSFVEELASKSGVSVEEQILLTRAMWLMDEEAKNNHMLTEEQAIAIIKKQAQPYSVHEFLKDLSRKAGVGVEEQIDLTRAMWLMDEQAEKSIILSEVEALTLIQRKTGNYIGRSIEKLAEFARRPQIREKYQRRFIAQLKYEYECYVSWYKKGVSFDDHNAGIMIERLDRKCDEVLGPIEEEIYRDLHRSMGSNSSTKSSPVAAVVSSTHVTSDEQTVQKANAPVSDVPAIQPTGKNSPLRAIIPFTNLLGIIACILGIISCFAFPASFHQIVMVSAGLCMFHSVTNVAFGDQNGLTTEIVTMVIGGVVAGVFRLNVMNSICMAVCIGFFLIHVVSIIVLFFGIGLRK